MIKTRARQLIAVLALVPFVACGGNPGGPSPQPLGLSCPATITVEATQPYGAPVTYAQPSARDGSPPYAIECLPSSGSVFSRGGNRVDCKVTDADRMEASCSFHIEVTVSRTLTKTRFLAFGDSLTAGTVSPALIDNPDSYPFKVQQMLRERYPAQEIVVLNDGTGGDRLKQGAAKLPAALAAHRPEVLLLLQGIIDVRRIPTAENAGYLRTMISTARQQEIDVIIATVMPVGAVLEAKEPGINAAVVKLNVEINRLAQEFSLGPPVDLYSLFNAEPGLIGRDSLHPTAEGYTRMAELWNAAIVSRYDQPTP